jgi:hypothetical protein
VVRKSFVVSILHLLRGLVTPVVVAVPLVSCGATSVHTRLVEVDIVRGEGRDARELRVVFDAPQALASEGLNVSVFAGASDCLAGGVDAAPGEVRTYGGKSWWRYVARLHVVPREGVIRSLEAVLREHRENGVPIRVWVGAMLWGSLRSEGMCISGERVLEMIDVLEGESRAPGKRLKGP